MDSLVKPRLFIFGDSFAFNYFSKEKSKYRPEQKQFLSNKDVEAFVKKHNYFGHWTDYLEKKYEIFNYGEPGCSNEDIVHQLCFLPEYKENDRMVILFTNASRYTWITDDYKRHGITNGSVWQTYYEKKLHGFLEEQIVIRDHVWNETDERKNEQQFYEKLSDLFEKYKPVKITWDESTNKKVPSILYMPYINEKWTNIMQETNNRLIDGHFGFFGNYKLYVWVANLLGLDEIEEISTKVNMI